MPDFSTTPALTPRSISSPHLRHAFAVHDVELDLLERRRELVLDHLDAGLVADHLVALLDRADPADVETHRGVEFQRMTAGRRLGRAVHHADLHADLVDEDHHRVGAIDRGGELAQRLAHQPRLQAGLAVAHLAFELGARHERGDRIDDEHVDRARAHQRVGDLQRLLAGIGLGNEEIIDIDAELARIDRIERMFGVDEGADAALLLRLRQAMQRQRGLAGGFRPVISTTRPRGKPPMPSAMSRPSEPVETVSTSIDLSFLPSRMIEPLPKLRSIWESAASRAFDLSMEEPSTRRSAAVAIAPTPYDRNRKTDNERPETMYTICSLFAICSFTKKRY